MSATEHILLESDVREVPSLRAARKVHAQIALRSRLRRLAVRLEIIDYYYLSVRLRRSRAPLAEYVLDLRFVRAETQVSRHVAWRSMAAAALAILASALAAWFGLSEPQHRWAASLMAVTGVCAVLAVLVCVYRTSESVTLYSDHGHVKVLEITSGLGTLRAVRVFLARLAAHTRLATAARRRSMAEHLRDEMREHFRLKEIGTLSADEYEAAKTRILGQHAHQHAHQHAQ